MERRIIIGILSSSKYTFERVKIKNVNNSWYPHMYFWVDSPQYGAEVGGPTSSKVIPLGSYITTSTSQIIYTFKAAPHNDVTYALYYDSTTLASGTILAGGSDVAINVYNSEHTILGHKIRAVMDYTTFMT